MSLLLYINGQLTDLDSKQHIAQTKQINDLNSISNRQSNYTNRFKLPKTANNIKIMGFLSLPGSNTTTPYQKNECFLYSESGECFVYKGWAKITDAGDNFDVVIYDGIIDLQKIIENKKFSDIDLSELNHTKNVATVTQSWVGTDAPYRYILADYGGKTGKTYLGEVNIDYLVPSVSVSYLWDKIQEQFGLTFTGSVFETEYFKNLWMTFPKGVSIEDNSPVLYECDDNSFARNGANHYIKCNSAVTNELEFADEEQFHLQIEETGLYRIDISGNINAYSYTGTSVTPYPFKIFYAKNVQGTPAGNVPVYNYSTIQNNIAPNSDFTIPPFLVNLNANDTLALLIQRVNPTSNFHIDNNSAVTVSITKLNDTNIDFSNGLSEFSIKDFIKEIVHRFALTMVKNSYTGVYNFITLEEQLQNAPTADWSDKYISIENENYIYGQYAQQNFFRYQYNDKESDYNDSYIGIDNVNITPKRDVIKSKIYSPQQNNVVYLNEFSHRYNLWEKEIDDDDQVSYKSLDKRFYFLRANTASYGDLGFNAPFSIYSDKLTESTTVSSIYKESFYRLSFGEIIQDYYSPLSRILSHSVIVNAKLWLTETDIANFDFIKLYYIEQLGSYFIVNKITNYVPGKSTKVELIKVIYGEAPNLISDYKEIKITNVNILENNNYEVEYELSYTPQYGSSLKFESSSNTINWEEADDSATLNYNGPVTINLSGQSSAYIRIKDNVSSVYSEPYKIKDITITNATQQDNDYLIDYDLSYAPQYPDVINFQISTDGVNWSETDFGIVSQTSDYSGPLVLENLNAYDGGYLRMIDISNGVTSNSYNFRKITITDVQNTSNNLYQITYNSNYTPSPVTTAYRIEVSFNGYTWYDSDNATMSHNGTTPVNLSDFNGANYIRIKNNISEITSNVFTL
ncbi:hypothetical protein GCM10007424_25070 [Flavobacterium suaedae]|uniref:Uncharacterized protein n=1 Tax=Flavobacterium suaedae TaxID=1767027 RepID=A0ABQ1K0M4_9FLAO|nr:hypothetical protein [Flavobacterium suaedae]GGB84052.1 hypothetical protein GCM10007424_25070 [Flavobacterium suaedae]